MYVQDSRLATKWTTLTAEKGDLIRRCIKYAEYTIPSICKPDTSSLTAAARANVINGPRLVNHLANRIVDTMFPHDKPFFTLKLKVEVMNKLLDEAGDAAGALQENIRASTSRVEAVAMRGLNMTEYRPRAVEATKHLIITGNALIVRADDGSRLVYGVKDYCIRRNIAGRPREIMLCDTKHVRNIPEDILAGLRSAGVATDKDTSLKLYTSWVYRNGSWEVEQAFESVSLDNMRRVSEKDFPLLPLTWTLARGDDYGSGLVEDNVDGFHAVDVSTMALQDTLGIIADVKYLVDPASGIDVSALNDLPRGGYIAGRDGDVTVASSNLTNDAAIIMQSMEKWERGLAQAFLLNSAGVRNAERVTAEEIRLWARELESAYGGLYSRLALEWQQKESEYAIAQIDFKSLLGKDVFDMFEVIVVTGLESLSREGQLDALRLAMQDLQMLDAIPDSIRATMDPRMLTAFIFVNRGVDLKQFLYSQAEMQKNQQAADARLQQQNAGQAQVQVAAAAGKQAMK